MTMSKARVIHGEPIQWHLQTSKYDESMCCPGEGMAYLAADARICKGCGGTFRLPPWVQVAEWAEAAKERAAARGRLELAEARMADVLRDPTEADLCDECGLPPDEHHLFHSQKATRGPHGSLG